LALTQASIPATGIAGQPVLVKWTTKNISATATSGTGWVDGVFLSNDLVLDAGDVLLQNKTRTQNLSAGQEYMDSLLITIPSNLAGNYVLIVGTDIHNNVFEYQAESNNSKYSFINVISPPPSDLVVTSVQSPLTAIAGQSVNISYTVKNTGLNPANGSLKDGIYLSRDDAWDISDPLIAVEPVQVNLAPGGEITRNATVKLTGVGIGSYKMLVRTDILDNIVEANNANNNQVSEDTIHIDVKLLPLNVVTPDTLVNNTYLYYKIQVPDSLVGETLLVTLESDSTHASNEMYIKFGNVPSRAVFDFNHGTTLGWNQELIVPALQAGTYYLASYGNNTSGSLQIIRLKASILPFAIRSVNSNRGGNTGSVTVELKGSKFEPGMQIKLDNGATTIIASSVYYVNTTKLFATFNLLNKPLGQYTVSARKANNSLASLTNGFEIIAGSGGGFYITDNGTADPGCDPHASNGINALINISAQYPPASRRNRVIAITVFFGNSGNVDLPVPTRFVFSRDGAPLSMTVEGLTQNLQELSLEFRENNGPPNILRPGATGSITFYTKSIANMYFIVSD
ncbi:MAG TPA: CARDB domain-containing protein, partial [Chitinophagaceae bacterium]|nr:CARDB domain-containing protein [Chitinophagaceae bacterium]